MKVAIVHDWLMAARGSEKQLKYIYECFPQADLFCLVYDKSAVQELFSRGIPRIKTSFLNNFPFKKKLYPYLLPLMPLAAESLDLNEYDVVISSSSNAAKGVVTRSDAMHISYIYTPQRNIWDLYSDYHGQKSKSSLMKSFLILPLISYLRIWDSQAAQRPDYLIAISDFVSKRVTKYYKRDSKVIYPGVEISETISHLKSRGYYLHITSFEPNKNTAFLVDVFNELGYCLKIVGRVNREARKILKSAKRNIEYLGWVSEEEKRSLIAAAEAVLVPGIEDFGMVSVETQSLGVPVIAYAQGGSLETVEKGFLFEEKSVESVKSVLDRLKASRPDQFRLRKNAMRFSATRFKKEFKKFVMNAYANRN